MKSSIPLIYNPAAGQRDMRKVVDEVCALFASAGDDVEPIATERAGHATAILEGLMRAADPPRDVLVLGGDGTLNEALLGVYQAGGLESAGCPPRFGILPAGTANVIARDLRLPLSPLPAAKVLLEGHERAFDVGLCQTEVKSRPFLLAFGAGIEAEVVRDVSPSLKRRIGRAAYVWAGIKAAGNVGRKIEVDFLREDGVEEHGVAAETVLCVNSRLYGGKIMLSKQASSSDGIFELLLLSNTSTPVMMALSLVAACDRIAICPGVRLVRVREATVRAPSSVAIHVDAELAGTTPVQLSFLPTRLMLRSGTPRA